MQRRKRRPKARKAPIRRLTTSADLRKQVADLTRGLKDAREHQIATEEILASLAESTDDAKPIFDAIVRNLRRLLGTRLAVVLVLKDGMIRLAAAAQGEEFERLSQYFPRPLDENTGPGRAMTTKQVLQFAPVLGNSAAPPGTHQFARDLDFNSVIYAPMIRGDHVVGVIGTARRESTPFDEEQVALIRAFAAQAVIAIENTRLLNELRESLQQQTATADVLKVISSSPGELEPVFKAILANATDICGAKFGTLYLRKDDAYYAKAFHNASPAFIEARKDKALHPGPETTIGRAARSKQVEQVLDATNREAYRQRDPFILAGTDLGGYRTIMSVPMLKDDELIGAITIYRQEVLAFNDKQIELVKNFAAQAVIAIENARLLNELRESLQQQTATADVLKVISSSAGVLQPVFNTMLAKAVELCGASFGAMWLVDGEGYRTAAMHGDLPQGYVEQWRSGTLHLPKTEIPLVHAVRHRETVHTPDMREEKAYLERDPLAVSAVEIAGIRTLVTVPMIKEGEAVGAITIYRREVLPFTEKQIELLENFAAQAVIAIENARLLNELRQRTDDLSESLEQQTATSEVLRVISSSRGELGIVFQTLLENATRICEAAFGSMLQLDGDMFRRVALHNAPVAFAEFHERAPLVDPRTVSDLKRVVETKQVVHVADTAAEHPDAPIAKYAGGRTLLIVPMLKGEDLVGIVGIYRQEVRPFTDKQIEIVKNFASQAVIAIENTRLLNELRQRTDDLSESLQQQTATSEVLQVISSSPGELDPVFKAILGNATRICDAKFGTLTQVVDGIPRLMFQLGVPSRLEEYWRRETPRPSPHNAISRVITTGQAVHVTDLEGYEAYIDRDPLAVAGVELGGIRTLLIVPMLKDGKTFGTIGIYRQDVRPFTDKQVELVSNFAAQAAIAIENTRLLKELRQRTDDLSKSLDDLRTTQDRLVQTQKLALLGQLTAGIAHEIKNPLNFVNNFSGISAELVDELQDALKGIPLDERARTQVNELTDTLKSNFDKVVHHGRRADAIVKNMLQHSREGSGEHRMIDINALVEESLNLAWHGARAEAQGFEIKLKQSFDPLAGEADIFPQDIRRALLNMISNGFYAATMRRAQNNGGDYEPMLTASTKSLGERVEINIRDNGTGMPPDVKEKMFNPFFTTKPSGEGTGLGLSISHDIIVKQHGGSIEVDTQPGEFTEIRVILPRVAVFV
jgi:GAF domain-containing protein